MAITNPYLQDQANAITNTATQNLNNNILPGVNAGAMAAGGYGGSRQGIAQGLAIGQTNLGLTNSLAGLYGTAYDADQTRANQMAMTNAQIAGQEQIAGQQNQTSRDLGFANVGLGYTQAGNQFSLGQQQNQNQAQANQNSFDLGLGSLGLGQQQADQNFYTAQRGQDLSQMGLGAQLSTQGNLGLTNQGSQLYQAGQTEQQAPYNILGQYGSELTPFTGLNQSDSKSTPGASSFGSALAGGLTISQLLQMLNNGG